jgi:hypothetical protein
MRNFLLGLICGFVAAAIVKAIPIYGITDTAWWLSLILIMLAVLAIPLAIAWKLGSKAPLVEMSDVTKFPPPPDEEAS